ncbi:MAG: type I 3-dehydroquinate dehydratase [Patescibacteria group bacterium]
MKLHTTAWPSGLIAASITGPTTEKCWDQIEKALEMRADTLEFRFDSMEQDCQQDILHMLPEFHKVRFILTHRIASHGGPAWNTVDHSLSFWANIFSCHPNVIALAFLIDWEWEIVFQIHSRHELSGTIIPWKKVLVSRHDMLHTPSEPTLRYMLGQMSSSRAGAMKFAFMSNSSEDNARILKLYSWNTSAKPVIAIGMGAIGIETRLKWLLYSALLTFGRIDQTGSAPGQPLVSRLVQLREGWREHEV